MAIKDFNSDRYHLFDREAFDQWFQHHRTNPLTRGMVEEVRVYEITSPEVQPAYIPELSGRRLIELKRDDREEIAEAHDMSPEEVSEEFLGAIRNQDISAVRFFLNSLDVNAIRGNLVGETPLIAAIETNTLPMVQLLLDPWR